MSILHIVADKVKIYQPANMQVIELAASNFKRCVYIFTFGDFNSKPVNVSGIQHFLAQLKGLEMRKENLNAANIYLN